MGYTGDELSQAGFPYAIDIDGEEFTHLPQKGNYKIAYLNKDTHEIAFFPDPDNFPTSDERYMQVTTWAHNGSKLNEAGLMTADQRFDEDGELISSGYETGVVELEDGHQPFLKSYYNPHIEPISFLYERPNILEEKAGEIVDAVATLDQLKREGTIATAESIVDWEEILEDVPVVTENPIQLENGATLPQAEYPYSERPHGMGDYLLDDFIDALYEDTAVEEREGIRFKEEFNPRDLILNETWLPSSSRGLREALAYNSKTGSITVSDLGEIDDAVFHDETVNQEIRMGSAEEFTDYHNIRGRPAD